MLKYCLYVYRNELFLILFLSFFLPRNIYEIGDHGGLIVLVSDTAATNVLQYSWDEGLTWNTYTFTSKPIDVTNIIIEPLNMSLKFLIYGTMTDEKQKGLPHFINKSKTFYQNSKK